MPGRSRFARPLVTALAAVAVTVAAGAQGAHARAWQPGDLYVGVDPGTSAAPALVGVERPEMRDVALTSSIPELVPDALAVGDDRSLLVADRTYGALRVDPYTGAWERLTPPSFGRVVDVGRNTPGREGQGLVAVLTQHLGGDSRVRYIDPVAKRTVDEIRITGGATAMVDLRDGRLALLGPLGHNLKGYRLTVVAETGEGTLITSTSIFTGWDPSLRDAAATARGNILVMADDQVFDGNGGLVLVDVDAAEEQPLISTSGFGFGKPRGVAELGPNEFVVTAPSERSADDGIFPAFPPSPTPLIAGGLVQGAGPIVVVPPDTEPPDTLAPTVVPDGAPGGVVTLKPRSTEVGSTFVCRVDWHPWLDCTPGSDGTWSTPPISAGSTTIEVRATDAQGKPDATPVSLTLDLTPPVVKIERDLPRFLLSTGSVFTMRVSVAGTTDPKLECFGTDEAPNAWTTCSTTILWLTLTGATDQVFKARVTDVVTGQVGSAEVVFGPDPDGPDTVITGGPEGVVTTAGPYKFTFASDIYDDPVFDGERFYCSLNDGEPEWCDRTHELSEWLNEGPITLSVAASDGVRRDATPATRTFIINTKPPEATIFRGPAPVTRVTTPTFHFRGDERGMTFACEVGGQTTACTSPFTTPKLADGSYTLTLHAKDAAGTSDPTPPTFAFRVDTRPPATTITKRPADVTADATPMLEFTADEEGATFACQVDGGEAKSCTSGEPFGPLDDGEHRIEVGATDEAGNVGSNVSASFVVDTVAPDTQITDGPADRIASRSASISFTGSDQVGVERFECRLDGGGWTACESPVRHDDLPDGTRRVEVRAVDRAGTPDGDPALRTFLVDATPPVTRITGAPDGPVRPDAVQISFASTDATTGVAGHTCRVDGRSAEPCTSPARFTGLADGGHRVEIRATDELGNEGDPVIAELLVDGTAPETTITGSPFGLSLDDRAEFTFVGSDAVGVDRFECRIDDRPWARCASPASYANVDRGTRVFEVRAIDQAGNVDPTPAARSWFQLRVLRAEVRPGGQAAGPG